MKTSPLISWLIGEEGMFFYLLAQQLAQAGPKTPASDMRAPLGCLGSGGFLPLTAFGNSFSWPETLSGPQK